MDIDKLAKRVLVILFFLILLLSSVGCIVLPFTITFSNSLELLGAAIVFILGLFLGFLAVLTLRAIIRDFRYN